MINFVEYLQLPAQIAVVVIGVIFVMNVIGEILEFKGKVVPEFMKRKIRLPVKLWIMQNGST